MQSCCHSGGEHGIAVKRTLETGNVLRNASAEQLNILRQVANIRPKSVSEPVANVGAAQHDRAGERRPDARERAG